MTSENLSFTVTPIRVQVGGSVVVRGTAGDSLHVLIPGGNRNGITLNNKGTSTVPEPVGSEGFFTITDGHATDPHTVKVTVYELDL